jgi:hypothetical protein
LNSALNGDLGPDQKKIAQAGIALTETLLKKNRDYGSSAFESPVLAPDLASRKALLVRMSDKVKRIAQLQKTGTAEVQESLEDTIGDLAGYSLLNRRFKFFVTFNPVQTPARTGASMAIETIVKSRLGTDLVDYTHEITEQVGIIEVKPGTDIQRLLQVEQYTTLFRGVSRVHLEEIKDEAAP